MRRYGSRRSSRMVALVIEWLEGEPPIACDYKGEMLWHRLPGDALVIRQWHGDFPCQEDGPGSDLSSAAARARCPCHECCGIGLPGEWHTHCCLCWSRSTTRDAPLRVAVPSSLP